MHPLSLLCALLVLVSPVTAQDTQGAADGLVRQIRALQHDAGHYGDGFHDTCDVLSALARSPRRYNELDGPFFRRAAEWLVAERATAEHGTVREDAKLVLGLAGTITPRFTDVRDAALERIATVPIPADHDVLMALRTVEGMHVELVDLAWPRPPDDADLELLVLAADRAETLAEPATDEVAGWTRWARAARLRGLVPRALPPLPASRAEASLADLLADLDTVIACHGVPVTNVPQTADVELPGPPPHVVPGRELTAALEDAARFLDDHQEQGRFGLELPGWSGPEPGITALCLSAAIGLAAELERPTPAWVDDGLDYLVALQKPDGAIYDMGLAVYTTAAAIDALLDGGRPADATVVERARRFLLEAQADEGEGYSSEHDPHYGGIGYGGDERPDLSNTQMAVEAARRAGTPTDDPFFTRAMEFLEKNQNLGEDAPMAWPRAKGGRMVSGTDGGATYMPGNSPAGELRVGEDAWVARSYGSMTYALTKSFLLCGLEPDHPRVVAAVRWLGANFRVDVNPGFDPPEKGSDGLYYYYLAMARTLRLLPDRDFLDADGHVVPWRAELTRHLIDDQRTDGSWINEQSPRWWEGAPTLATGYAALTLLAAVSD